MTDEATVRVLLVDDHQMLREGLARVMVDAGLDVVGQASDGAEGASMAARLKPDVVLMDVTMPVLDGIEATRRIKADTPEVPVLILTMHGEPGVFRKAIEAGAAGYLVKDASSEEVVEAIRTVASGRTALSPGLATAMLDNAGDGENRILTAREEEVLQLIADGLATNEVADRLYISMKTVKNHLASIYQKIDARDRTQAVVNAVRMGIIRLD